MIYFVISIFFFYVTIYPNDYAKLPKTVQILVFAVFFVGNVFAGTFIDEFRYGQIFQILKKEKKTLEGILRTKTTNVEELQRLIARFINYSVIYKSNIIDKLNIDEEFLCIIKSSEGFGKIWNKLDEKSMLPFTKVLSEWPGSVKPFENDGFFIIPIKNAIGIKKKQIRSWVTEKVIPKVKKEREKFIKNLPKELRNEVDNFSYKYIAFILRKNSIDYDHENRKFNDPFLQFIIQNQGKRTLSSITENLKGIITVKDVFTAVEWDAFIEDLNDEQSDLIHKNRKKLSDLLAKKGIKGIKALSAVSEDDLKKVVAKALGSETTPIKSKNIANKIILGSKNVVRILNTAGVEL